MKLHLPLHDLWVLLEANHIRISSYERIEAVRVMQILAKNGRFDDFFSEFKKEERRDELKFSLGAVIAKTPDEQKKFYEIFDGFWEKEFSKIKPPTKVEEIQTKTEPPFISKIVQRILWGILAAIILIFLLNFPPIPSFLWKEKTFFEGDTLRLSIEKGKKINFVSPKKITWFFNDIKIDSLQDKSTISPVFSQSQNLKIKADIEYNNWWKSKTTLNYSTFIDSICNKISIKALIANATNSFSPGQNIFFKINTNFTDISGNFTNTWDFGDGSSTNDESASHAYNKSGRYTVKLSSIYNDCSYTDSLSVLIDSTAKLAIIPVSYYPYIEMPLNSSYEWKPTFKYVFNNYDLPFIALFIFGLLILLPKIFKEFRKAPSVEIQEPKNSPFTFGFSDQNSSINIKEAQFQWADVLRHRQASERLVLNPKKSIEATIKAGNFPKLAFSRFSKESEHLILIDEKNINNQQTKVFDFLMKWIKEQDVHVVIYFFLEDPRVCWNSENPSGISIEKLASTYSTYRLLVISDGESLIDLQSKEIKTWVKISLDDWAYKVLFTPVWAVYWNFQEAILSKYFTLLPASPDGKLWLNHDLESNSKPSFTTIRNRFTDDIIQTERGAFGSENEQVSPAEIRSWLEKSVDNSDSTTNDPRLYYWALATVLYQIPSLEMTIALGRAIENETIIRGKSDLVTTLSLLKITAMPWLKKRNISKETQKTLSEALEESKKELGIDIEDIARREILAMLESNKPPENTIANHEWNKQKALQWLEIEPNENENTVRDESVAFLQALNEKGKIRDEDLKQKLNDFDKERQAQEIDFIKNKKQNLIVVRIFFTLIFLPIFLRQMSFPDKVATQFHRIFQATKYDSTAIFNNKVVAIFKNNTEDNKLSIVFFDSLKLQNYYLKKAYRADMTIDGLKEGQKNIVYLNYLKLVSNMAVNLYKSSLYKEVANDNLLGYVPLPPNAPMRDSLLKYTLFNESLRAISYYHLDQIERADSLIRRVELKNNWRLADANTRKNINYLNGMKSNSFDAMGNFVNRLAWVKKGKYFGYINESFKEVLPTNKYKFEEAKDFQPNGLAIVKTEGAYALIKKDGKIIAKEFEEIYPFNSGFARVKIGGNYGFLRENGEWAYTPYLNYADDYNDGFAYVELGGFPSYFNKEETVGMTNSGEQSTIKFLKLHRIENLITFEQRLKASLDISWRRQMSREFIKPYFSKLTDFVVNEYTEHKVFPPAPQIFEAFNLCPFDDVKVVIIGPEPYYGTYQGANGLAFSVIEGAEIPAALMSIFEEWKYEFMIKNYPKNGDLSYLAKQGVLLLNTCLTVREGLPTSHNNLGWKDYTDEVIKKISSQKQGVVFMLWGNQAQAKSGFIDPNKHLILMASDPTPTSVDIKKWLGNYHFIQANRFLESKGKVPIDWLERERVAKDFEYESKK